MLYGNCHVNFETALGKVATKRETVPTSSKGEDPSSIPFSLVKATAVVVQTDVGCRDAGLQLQLDGVPGDQVYNANAGLHATRGGHAPDEKQS